MEEPKTSQTTAKKRKNKEKVKKSITVLFFVLLILSSVIVSFLPCGAEYAWRKVFRFFGVCDFSNCADDYPFSVHVLDVGKADSILIECNGTYMLVDGGTVDCGDAVSRYLIRRGIKQLDYVVNTHPDSDHIGGFNTVLKKFKVNRYFAPKLTQKLVPESTEYKDVQNLLRIKSIKTEHPVNKQTLSLSNTKIEVLLPFYEQNSANNSSIILRLIYGNTSFLLMGDAEQEEETDLLQSNLNLKSDVIKIGHHGSSTSSSEKFLKAVKPQFAAISVGDDRNNLPKNLVLQRLEQIHTKIYRTDFNGTLLFLSDGKNITIQTER